MDAHLAASGGRRREWVVRLTLVEEDTDTTAEALLETDTGALLSAVGRSHRNEHDAATPGIGDEVAVARALRNLADAVLTAATSSIERATGEHHVLVRPR